MANIKWGDAGMLASVQGRYLEIFEMKNCFR